jgi:hypothetical protein
MCAAVCLLYVGGEDGMVCEEDEGDMVGAYDDYKAV